MAALATNVAALALNPDTIMRTAMTTTMTHGRMRNMIKLRYDDVIEIEMPMGGTMTVPVHTVIGALTHSVPARKPHKKSTKAIKLSRILSLAATALDTGKWRTGVDILPDKAVSKIVEFNPTIEDLQCLTIAGMTALNRIRVSPGMKQLSSLNRSKLEEIINRAAMVWVPQDLRDEV